MDVPRSGPERQRLVSWEGRSGCPITFTAKPSLTYIRSAFRVTADN